MSDSRNKYKRPPYLAELLFKIYFPDEGRFTTLGDLNEVYSSIFEESGVFRARIWYWHQLVKSLLPFLTHSIYWGITMFFNFLKTSFRNISRNKLSSIINFTGLTIGLVAFSLILKFVLFESSFDDFQTDKENIYRLTGNGFAKVPDLWAPGLKEDMPEVKNYVRLQLTGTQLFEHGNIKSYEESGFYADSNFFQFFSFKLLRGNKKIVLTEPNTIVLTKSFAEKYFGNTDPVGQSISMVLNAEEVPFRITGIVEDPPKNSHITYRYLISMSSNDAQWVNNWKWNQFYTYLKLNKGVQTAQLEPKIFSWLKTKIDDNNFLESISLQKISDIYLHSNLKREIGPTRDISTLYIFSAIALLILSIVVINFANLNTARAFTRIKEVGVRKTSGASRSSIIKRFVGESLLMSTVAFAGSLLIIFLLVGDFSKLMNTDFNFNLLSDWNIFLTGFAVSLTAGIGGSIFPALYLSSLDPSKVLKGEKVTGSKTIVRKVLVGLQFGISAVLFIGAIVVSSQLNFIQSKDMGFQKDQMLVFKIRNDNMRDKSDIILKKLKNYPGIINASVSSNLPGGSDYGIPYRAEGITKEETPPCRILAIDKNFVDTYNLKIVKGRNFSDDFSTDKLAYLINETAAKELRWKKPVNKKLSMPAIGRDWGNIVGVVKDFHYRNLHEKIEPLILMRIPEKRWRTFYSIKFNPQSTKEVLAYVNEVWDEFDKVNPFDYFFMDDLFAQQYEADQKDGLLINIFTIIAVFLACLGLFGLTSFSLVRRTKEIGVRKVLGATSHRIYWEVIREFFLIVIVSNIIALPVAYYFINDWLQNFAYKVSISAGMFVLTFLVGLTMVIISTLLQTYRASNLNPSDALRYE